MSNSPTPFARVKSTLWLMIVVACAVMLGSSAFAAGPRVSVAPPINPPTTKPHPFVGDLSDLASYGYIQEEFFFENTSPVPYKSRLIVFRPKDPNRFNGTAVVEWLNVSAGYDINVGWGLFQDEILRSGYAFVGVDAQMVGVDHLKRWDPVRYGALVHPDSLPPSRPPNAPEAEAPPAPAAAARAPQLNSFMVYSQAALALRGTAGVRPLGSLAVKYLIGYGNSQSAGRLSSLVNDHPDLAKTYDGYIIHAGPRKITNTRVKVFGLNSENEAPGYYVNRNAQPGADSYAYWEIAGTNHMPSRSLTQTLMLSSIRDKPNGANTEGQNRTEASYAEASAIAPRQALGAELAGNAILHHVNVWIATGKRPPTAPFMEMIAGTPNTIVRDQYGNAKGGVRYPHVVVPVARYWLKGLFPAVDPFNGEKAGAPGPSPNDTWDEPTLIQLYPTHDDYVRRVHKAADDAVEAGFLLKVDADALKKQAEGAKIP